MVPLQHRTATHAIAMHCHTRHYRALQHTPSPCTATHDITAHCNTRPGYALADALLHFRPRQTQRSIPAPLLPLPLPLQLQLPLPLPLPLAVDGNSHLAADYASESQQSVHWKEELQVQRVQYHVGAAHEECE
jgi:hypothetical protein